MQRVFNGARRVAGHRLQTDRHTSSSLALQHHCQLLYRSTDSISQSQPRTYLGVGRRQGVMPPNGHTLIAGKHFSGCYTGDLQLYIRLTGSFSDHKGNTSETMMAKKDTRILGKLLPLTGRQVGLSNQKFCIRL